MRALVTALWWGAFLTATFALSKVFEAARLLTAESPDSNLWNLLLWGAVLATSLLVMGYDSYAKSKAEGKVVHHIWLFEKIHHCLTTGRSERCR